MKRLILMGVLIGQTLLACPDGEHSECILPRPWPGRGCAQFICVPNVKNPFDSFMQALQSQAFRLADEGERSEVYANREDCVVVVTAGLAIWGTANSGPYGGIAAGAAGAAASRIACRKVFPVD